MSKIAATARSTRGEPAAESVQRSRPRNLSVHMPPVSDVEPAARGACACGGGCPQCSPFPSLIRGAMSEMPMRKRGGVGSGRNDLRVTGREDSSEREAEHAAERVIRSPVAVTAAQEPLFDRNLREGSEPSPDGEALPPVVRAFMEPRFGVNLGGVRIHTDREAADLCRRVNAQAFTLNGEIYFGHGRLPGNDSITAHELIHALQQTGGLPGGHSVEPDTIQRIVEVRPPGRGEATAFDRRQDLVDRMTAVSGGLRFSLDGRRIEYEVEDASALTFFDRQMMDFIDRAEVVPMRLITGAGLVRGESGDFEPLLVDSFINAYVDVEDILAGDDTSFQMNMVHILVERFHVPDYDRRIGTNMGSAFRAAHRAGNLAEASFLQDQVGDPTIRFVYEEERPNGTLVFGFRSDEGYRIFHVFRRGGENVRGGIVWAQLPDRTRLSLEELRAHRARAAAPSSAP